MGDFDLDNRQRGLLFAGRLERLARQAPSPEVKQKVDAVVYAIRREYGLTDQEKVEAVFKLIVDGAVTPDDLHWETGFPLPKISEIINKLKTSNRIQITKLPTGRQGPQRQIIKPIS